MSASILLDTNVASFYFARADASASGEAKAKRSNAALYDADVQGRHWLLSFQTLAEMLRGARAARWGAKRVGEIERFIEQFEVVVYDRALADAWAEVMTDAARRGIKLREADGWVAACAIRRGVRLIAHDRDLARLHRVSGLDVRTHLP